MRTLVPPHFSLQQRHHPMSGQLVRHDGMTVKLLTYDDVRKEFRAIVRRGDPEKTAKIGDYVYILEREIPPPKVSKKPIAIPV